MENHQNLSHGEFKIALDQLVAEAGGNPAEFDLSPAEIDALQAGSETLNTDIKDQAAKAAASKAATTKLTETRKTLNTLFAKARRRAKDSGAAPDRLVAAGIQPDDKIKSKIPVYDPQDLVASGSSNGTHTTKWDKNGNQDGTLYNVEVLLGAAADFVLVGTTTVPHFEHKNQKPGVKAVYRVRAQRGDDFSDYSNEASLY